MAVSWYYSFKRTNVSLAASHALAKAAAGVKAKALKEDPEWDTNECSVKSIRGLKWREQNLIHHLAISSELMHNHMVQLSLEGRGFLAAGANKVCGNQSLQSGAGQISLCSSWTPENNY